MTERDKYSNETLKAFHRLYTQKMDIAIIAGTLHITTQTLKNWFKSLGLPLHRQGGFNRGKRKVSAIAQEDYLNMTLKELAKKYAIAETSVVRILTENRIPRKGRGKWYWQRKKAAQPKAESQDTCSQSSGQKSRTSE